MGTRKLAVVTGSTSGIGLATANDLLAHEWTVVGIARRETSIDHPEYHHVRADLGDLDALDRTITGAVADRLAAPDLERVALVNNAALFGSLSAMSDVDPVALGTMFAVNSAAPLFLMGWFADRVTPPVRLRVANVSSGAAHTAFAGLADYCASKAALRLAGQTLAVELENAGRTAHDAAVLSYEPGLVETAMQTAARETKAFPGRETFVEFAEQGRLNRPDAVVGPIRAFVDGDPPEHFVESRFEGG